MQYEYKEESNIKLARINELGEQGWELVAVNTPPSDGYYHEHFYFKRIKQ